MLLTQKYSFDLSPHVCFYFYCEILFEVMTQCLFGLDGHCFFLVIIFFCFLKACSLFLGIQPGACAAQGKGFSCCIRRFKKRANKSGWTLTSYICAIVDLS